MSNRKEKVKVGILGATGYTGLKLCILLSKHRHTEIGFLSSESSVGQLFSDVHPRLKTINDKKLISIGGTGDLSVDIVFSCLPYHEAMFILPGFWKNKIKIVDLSADFRLDTPESYAEWYEEQHIAPELLKEAIYGLPEINRQRILKSTFVANPGCYPTSVILGLAPLLENDLIDRQSIIIDAKSGVSGAGRKPSLRTHFVESNENVAPYNIGHVHRHIGEIEQELSKLGSEGSCRVIFSPHLVPLNQGICSTIYADLKVDKSTSELVAIYQERYEHEPFVRVIDDGLPETRFVQETNLCDVSIERIRETNKIIIVSVIDNLIKGAAGQAIQNMNLMCGFEETEGLL